MKTQIRACMLTPTGLICISVVLFFVCLNVPVGAQERSVPVHKFFDQVVSKNLDPIAYEVEFRIRKNQLEVSNERNATPVGRLTETNGIMRIDELAGMMYVETKTVVLDTFSVDQKLEERIKKEFELFRFPGMRLILPDREFVCQPTEGFVVERTNDHRSLRQKLFFDYRSFGWTGDYTFEDAVSFDEILRTLKQGLKPELVFQVSDDGLATLDLGDDELVVDTKRGYRPIERKIWSSMIKQNRYIRNHTKIKLVEFQDEWLPERIDWIWESKKGKVTEGIDLKWLSFGKTIPAEKFDPDFMRARLAELSKESSEKKSSSSPKPN